LLPSDETQVKRTIRGLSGKTRLEAELIALAYIGTIAAIASATGAFYILFPELAALSYDVLGRPRGRWASAPFLLAITPVLTGTIGTIVTRSLPYGFASVLITVGGAIAVLSVLRSPIAPAISAGLLPLVLGVKSWWYPPGILFDSALLALISNPWKRYTLEIADAEPPETTNVGIAEVDTIEITDVHTDGANHDGDTTAIRWLAAIAIFVVVAVALVKVTGLRFILFPPLVVIAYEMFRHPVECPWSGQTLRLPLVCFLCALGGFFFHAAIPNAPLAAICSMAWGIAVLRSIRLHVPPALAVALLPMVMEHPTIKYPFTVLAGTALVAGWFGVFEMWTLKQRRRAQA
jgi:hypothetical protein